ncbi:MAG: TIGR04283 family arsenosugar biosynthesis glycosyltransferase [Gemmatimonadota bacterium]|nr:TIGR04283 family arsenosugar biosynthesis glycosyltransferase [Gemmatimonadota bacterium]
MKAVLAIVIPALNEADALPALLSDLRALTIETQVMVVDGGSTDGTVAAARSAAAEVIVTRAGRGAQLAAGALATSAPFLCFLHADVRLGADARRALERLAARAEIDGGTAHAFSLAIDADGWSYRTIERGANWRSRWMQLPYGDQGLALPRALYERAGGYADVPIMEDVALVRALRRVARVAILPERVMVSARRWRRHGVLRRTLLNWLLLIGYAVGTSPRRLARWYRVERAPTIR